MPFALATVVQTWGSAPREVGSVMSIRFADGEPQVLGSVSAGCVEGAVIQAAEATMTDQKPQLLDFGVQDETAWSVGLTCGGQIRVFVEPFMAFSSATLAETLWRRLVACVESRSSAVLLTRMNAEQYDHLLVIPASEQQITEQQTTEQQPTEVIGDWGAETSAACNVALQALKNRASTEAEVAGARVFVRVLLPPPQLIVVGAGHITTHLVKFARELGFETIVIDPRGVFADEARFSEGKPDKLLNAWPDEVLQGAVGTPALVLTDETYAVTLTHDTKIDDPALHIFLRSRIPYIGALGSKKSTAARTERLQKAGFSAEQIARIHAPVGLAIGAKTPAEIALAILAQITAVRRGVHR